MNYSRFNRRYFLKNDVLIIIDIQITSGSFITMIYNTLHMLQVMTRFDVNDSEMIVWL